MGYGTLASVSPYEWLIVIIFIWDLVWKAFALWKSARLGQSVWFVLILILNTAGILPILYLFLFSKRKNANKVQKTSKRGPKKRS